MYITINNLKQKLNTTIDLHKFYKDYCGIEIKVSGDQIIIDDTWITKHLDAINFVEISKRYPVKTEYDQFCDSYTTHINSLDDAFIHNLTSSVNIPGQFDILTEYKLMAYKIFFANKKDIKGILKKDLYNFITKFDNKITNIRYVTTKPTEYQKLISFPKTTFYINEYGAEKAKQYVLEKDSLRGLIPSGFELTSYYNCFMCMSPHMFAMPLTHLESTIYLNAINNFNLYEIENLSLFQTGITDFTVMRKGDSLSNLLNIKIKGYAHRQYMDLICFGINNLIRSLCNYKYFVVNNKINLIDSLKILSAVKLLFSDFTEIDKTLSIYSKQRYAFSMIDKLANIRCRNGGKEEDDTKYLTSTNMKKELVSIFKAIKKSHNEFDNVLTQIIRFTDHIYDHVRDKINKDINGKNNDYCEYLRTIRNTQHGSYLYSKRYEKSFITSTATIPTDMYYIPLLIMWGLIMNPKKILKMNI